MPIKQSNSHSTVMMLKYSVVVVTADMDVMHLLETLVVDHLPPTLVESIAAKDAKALEYRLITETFRHVEIVCMGWEYHKFAKPRRSHISYLKICI